MVGEDDWDELSGRPRNRKKRRKRRNARPSVEELDAEHHRAEETEFLRSLGDKAGKFEWMKEKRFNTMFRDIEAKIQGAMGTGAVSYTHLRAHET